MSSHTALSMSIALRGALILIVIFAMAKAGLSSLEKNILYHPIQEDYPVLEDLGIEEVSLTSEMGNTIYAGFHKTASEEFILFFHGNAGNINANRFNLEALLRIKKSFLMIDYPGYGKSSGSPSEESLYDAARAAYDFVIKQGYTAQQIIIDGQSLGGAVAAQLALEKEAKSLILESTFTSTHGMAKVFYPWIPQWILPTNKFNTIAKVPSIDEPILILHGENDEIVPFEQAIELKQAAPNTAYLFPLPDGMHNQDTLLPVEIQNDIDQFIATGTVSND